MGDGLGRAFVLLKAVCIKVDMLAVIAQDPNSMSFKALVDESLAMLSRNLGR